MAISRPALICVSDIPYSTNIFHCAKTITALNGLNLNLIHQSVTVTQGFI